MWSLNFEISWKWLSLPVHTGRVEGRVQEKAMGKFSFLLLEIISEVHLASPDGYDHPLGLELDYKL